METMLTGHLQCNQNYTDSGQCNPCALIDLMEFAIIEVYDCIDTRRWQDIKNTFHYFDASECEY